MGKIKKKGASGQAKNFITRTQAVRKLQITLPDFRRLCIFKGIYPREPRNKKKASKSSTPSTTFYYTKDIQYLLHEPLLNKFRDHKALAKKIAKSLGRGEVGDAARLEKTGSPKISLDHIIKERYPTFVDALRDLDDALSLLFLFANLPSTSTVPFKTVALCQRLCLEFEHYLISTNSLRKSFLSIKGIYYQATINGQDVLWLVPYKFVQRVTGDVDFRIMGTFVEFYTTLLGFVNFRLYTSIGLIYPPQFDSKSDEQGAELGAFTLKGKSIEAPSRIEASVNGESEGMLGLDKDIQIKVDAIGATQDSEDGPEQESKELLVEEVNDRIDVFETTGEGADILPQPQMSGVEASTLFAPFSFFLSRETPRQPLEFILRAFGCKRVSWDAVLGDGAFTNNEYDTSITHQVIDRPPLPESSLPEVISGGEDSPFPNTARPGGRVPGRTYIQPQWVWDCINEGKLLRPDLYGPGATLPPHLSPWVKPTKGAYDPTAPLAEQEREGEAEEAEGLEDLEDSEDHGDNQNFRDSDDVEDEEYLQVPGIHPRGESTFISEKEVSAFFKAPDENDMDVAVSNEDSSDPESHSIEVGLNNDSDFGGFSSQSESDPETAAQTQHQRELEAEAAGFTLSESTAATKANGELVKGILKSRPPMGKGEEARKRASKKRKEEEEELERRKMMMGRKKRKVLDKMLYSNRKKEGEAEVLRGKRRKIEREGARV